MKAILIAEKPSLMREIQAAYKGHRAEIPMDIDFLAQAGHLVGLMTPEEIDKKYSHWTARNFPISVPYRYKVLPKKEDLVQKIQNAVKSGEYDFVIHAGDPDGEGELLVRLVLSYVGNALPVKRFWSNDLTRGAIVNALKGLKDDAEYDPVYQAALVRQHADYQFGMNVTGTATLKLGDLYKLGRVKAPIIKMIVDREREIENFVQKSTWKRMFTYEDCEFVNGQEFQSREEALAQMPAADFAVVARQKDELKNHKAPRLYKLSTLQTDAHRRLGMSASQTLSVLQKLYEAKLVSYPRTSCEYISSAVDVKSISESVAGYLQLDKALLVRSPQAVKGDPLYANNAAIASEGHTAIIPTGTLPQSLTEREEKLYQLIARRFLAIFGEMKQVRNLETAAFPGGEEKAGEYVWKETLDVKPGFEIILDPKYKKKEGKGKAFREGEILRPVEFAEKECVSKPPVRYNDGSLIAALDKPEAFQDDEGKVAYQIGTPATRASIIEECIKCEYFTKDRKGVFYPTEKAEYVVDALGDISLFQVTNSGRWESLLEQIRQGKADAGEVEEELLTECRRVTADILGREVQKRAAQDEPLGKCPSCGGDVVTGRYGAYCKNKCGMYVSKAFGKKLTDSQVRDLLQGKKILVRGLKSKAGKTYDAYLKPDGITESGQYKFFRFQMEFANRRYKGKKKEEKS